MLLKADGETDYEYFETEVSEEEYSFIWKINNVPLLICYRDKLGLQNIPLEWKEKSKWQLQLDVKPSPHNEKYVLLEFKSTLKEILSSSFTKSDNLVASWEIVMQNQNGKVFATMEKRPAKFTVGRSTYLGLSTFAIPSEEDILVLKGTIKVHSANLNVTPVPAAFPKPLLKRKLLCALI